VFMNTTNDVLDHLMQTLEDGTAGFTDAAGRLDELSATTFAISFRELAQQRIRFHNELREMAIDLGYEPSDAGTLAAKLHRGWMAIQDAISGDSPVGILVVAEQGEGHAIAVYEKAALVDIPAILKATLVRQLSAIRIAHETIKGFLKSI
jgi:uncharacterized protein (TIGR02284 family)